MKRGRYEDPVSRFIKDKETIDLGIPEKDPNDTSGKIKRKE